VKRFHSHQEIARSLVSLLVGREYDFGETYIVTLSQAFNMTEIQIQKVVIRPAEIKDLNALDEFIKPFVELKILIPRTFDELTELIQHGFVAEYESGIIGFSALEVYSSKLGEIRSLAVQTEFQGMGIGQKLVDVCIERAREKNVLEVMAITSSEQFFKTCGFDFTLPGEKKALFIQTRDL
jgi:N-acetylglutamate synthase-like GNAT family acetyltransferase